MPGMRLRRTGAPPLLESLAQEMDQLQANINRMFENPMISPDAFAFARPIGWMPAMEITESDEGLVITAELPGLDQKDVKVDIDGDLLSIRGEKKAEEEKKGKQYHLVERSYGAFQRAFTLPPTVDRDKITAEFAKGVLTLRLPKGAEVTPKGRVIPVSAK